MIEADTYDFRNPQPDADLFAKGYSRLPRALGQMGFDGLRPGGQDQIVNALLAGVDSLCIMPTSAGKSACFTIPALCHDWRLLVFSPLKALMTDQVRSLQDKGIPALALSSDESPQVNQRSMGDWLDGACKILFIAPERLANQEFREMIRKCPPDMVAIDEVHCLSQWTDNFRHNYVKIGDLIEECNPRLVAGFTATYSKEIDADVRRVLRIPEATLMAFYPRRENLHLSSSELERDDYGEVARKVSEIDGPVLLYCDAQKRVEEWAYELGSRLGKNVGYFHAGVAANRKKETQSNFLEGRIDIMVATNAFGMGIDKPDIRSVIHIDHPTDPEALSQEVGRAGRDGKDSWCHTFSSSRSESMCKRRIGDGNPTPGTIRQFYDYITSRATRDNLFDVAPRKVQQDLGLSEYAYYPLTQLFMGAGIMIKAEGVARYHKLKIHDRHGCSSKAFGKLVEGIDKLASSDPEDPGWLCFDMDLLAEEMEVSRATAMKNVKGWAGDKIIEHLPPPRQDPKRIVGGMELIDLDRMAAKRRQAFKKLEVVLGYFDVDDAEKHGYLEEYFTAFLRE